MRAAPHQPAAEALGLAGPHQDPIVAIASAPGRGAVGIVRASGRDLGPLIAAVCGRALVPRQATLLPFVGRDGQPLDRGLAQAGFIRLTGTREAFPDYPGPVAACRREWAQAHPDVASAFQAAWAASWAWLLDPAHAEAAVALAAQRFDVPQAAATAVLERLRTQGLPGIDAGGLGVVSELVGEDLAAREAVPDPASLLWLCGA